MTATDELRRLLDERGVEYDGSFGGIEFYGEDGSVIIACNPKSKDGVLYVHAYLTPEQAIEATLGRGECKVVSSTDMTDVYEYIPTSYWRFAMSCGCEFDWMDRYPPRHCPNCGRSVKA